MILAWRLFAASASLLLAGPADNALADDSSEIEQQRAAFRQVYPDVERGNWQPVLRYEPLLEHYVLWPDLKATYFRARLDIADHAEIRTFLDRYGMLKPARELRYRFALHLAEAGHHAEYLDLYRAHYEGLEIAMLDCLAVKAEIAEGRLESVIDRALSLWLVGESQVEECDPVFSHLRGAGILTDEHYEKRFALAVGERRFSLAHYLSRPLAAHVREQAEFWLEARDDSIGFLRTHADRAGDDVSRVQLLYALDRVAFRDPLLASELWQGLQETYQFTSEHRQHISRHIALWAARRQLPEARALLHGLPADAIDDEVRRWMIRVGLRRQEWPDVLRAIALLPGDEQRGEEWRYWEAIALKNAGQVEPAAARLETLALKRSYYGFLASDELDQDYVFADSRLAADAAVAATLMERPALKRARELYHVGLYGRGRSEWDADVSKLSREEQVQAAILAHRWGWHSRAIATASMLGEFDDLAIRYPLPWREAFAQYAREAGVDDSLVFGIARSESLFMRDVRSAAGAVGIMQILPATGRRIAREIRFPYSGIATLTNATSSIQLGTIYLGKMFDRFAENRVLATAAYNAGPLNVEAWLPDIKQIDARIWIENIPYDETRQYVRRVLTAETIFHWRLTGRIRRLSSKLSRIEPPAQTVADVD